MIIAQNEVFFGGFFLLILVAHCLIFGGFCSFVAGEKGRDGANWFILGVLFSLPALIAIAGCPSLNQQHYPTTAQKRDQSKDPELDRELARILGQD